MITTSIAAQANIKKIVFEPNYALISSQGWIASQYKNYSIRIKVGLLETSISNSDNFEKSLSWALADTIDQAHVMKNGNILLVSNTNKIYLTDINLTSVVEKTVYESDGITPYTFHTPVDPTLPGKYFFSLTQTEIHEETDMYCWGNYGNVRGGATPLLVTSTDDFGETIKIAYKFGQNPVHRDNGTEGGGNTGTLLGDPNNPIYCRHVHSLVYNKYLDSWYCIVGDHGTEVMWLEGKFRNGTWIWEVVDFGFQITQQSRLKVVEAVVHQGYVYYGTDTTGAVSPNPESGIWRVPVEQLRDITKHEKVANFKNDLDVAHAMKIDPITNTIIFLTTSNSTISYTNVIGFAYGLQNPRMEYIDLANLEMPLNRLSSPNLEGQYLIDTKQFETLHNRYIVATVK